MARLVGINHVALVVGDVGEAIDWYGRFFELSFRGRSRATAFVDLGDQFIALERGEARPGGHFGLVVDDKEAVRRALEAAGVRVTPPPSLDFRDPWGNHVQVVDYRDVQFTKAPEVLRGMGLELEKGERALAELRDKGLYD